MTATAKAAERETLSIPARPKGRNGDQVRMLLSERFPMCFAPKGQPKRPLKIGIYKDIRAELPETEITVKELNRGLCDYTSGPSYLEAHAPGAQRVDLQGNPVGIVTDEESRLCIFRARGMRAGNIALSAIRKIAKADTNNADSLREIAKGALARLEGQS